MNTAYDLSIKYNIPIYAIDYMILLCSIKSEKSTYYTDIFLASYNKELYNYINTNNILMSWEYHFDIDDLSKNIDLIWTQHLDDIERETRITQNRKKRMNNINNNTSAYITFRSPNVWH